METRICKAAEEAASNDAAFRRDLIEVLKKHHMNALVAVGHLQMFCDDILCHFNTEDIRAYDDPLELKVHLDKRKRGTLSHEDVLSYAFGEHVRQDG